MSAILTSGTIGNADKCSIEFTYSTRYDSLGMRYIELANLFGTYPSELDIYQIGTKIIDSMTDIVITIDGVSKELKSDGIYYARDDMPSFKQPWDLLNQDGGTIDLTTYQWYITSNSDLNVTIYTKNIKAETVEFKGTLDFLKPNNEVYLKKDGIWIRCEAYVKHTISNPNYGSVFVPFNVQEITQ